MKYSKLTGQRYKEKPAEATCASHIFMLRGGYMRQVANGIYTLMLPAQRIVAKIEQIIREEMNAIDGQEIKMPVVIPRELWEESGRYNEIGVELLRMNDRYGHGLTLGMTHEEVVVHLARTEAKSYKDYPFMLYQIQTKFRDEARSRGGLIRVREFTMKDAYSFHTSQEDLERYYKVMARAYERIFARIGIPEVVRVQSDSGMMGGKVADEYMLLCEVGEDTIVTCSNCNYLANREVGIGIIEDYPETEKPIEKVYTPNTKSIEDVTNLLKIAPSRTAKSVFYKTAQGALVLALIRGDLEVNELKLSKIFKSELVFANDDEIRAAGAIPGFASGIGLKNCTIIADPSVANSNNLVAGSNEQDYHIYNFNLRRDVPNAKLVDIAMARNGDTCPICSQGKLVLKRGVEVGQIFQLGTRYTTSMKMTYTDLDNTEKTPIMGCYGIGVGRNLACIAEARHDAKGIFWPITIAPWQVQINVLNLDNGNLKEVAEKLYLELTQQGLEVIYDDRNLPAGQQFAEADLLGVPLRLVISPRNMEKGQIEWKVRTTGESGFIDLTAAVNFVNEWVKNELAKINASCSLQQ